MIQTKQMSCKLGRRSCSRFSIYRFFVHCLIILWFLVTTPLSAASESHFTRVLVLHSYHDGFTWSDSISDGIREQFSRKSKDTELKFEYLDTRFQYSRAYLSAVAETLRIKYKDLKIDAIITVDDHALNFVVANGADIFPGVPVVFCSASGYRPEMRKLLKLTGLQESLDITGTLKLAIQLHPNTEEIFVILDRSRTGQALKAKFDQAWEAFSSKLKLHYLENLSVEQLKRVLPSVRKNAIVLLFIFGNEPGGRALPHEKNLERLRRSCPVPIYSFWQFYLGYGIVGGRLINGTREGKLAADMALEILGGREALDIPLGSSPISYMFDHKEMVGFGLDRSSLPENSTVINKPFSFFETYRVIILYAAIVFLFLLIIIVALLLSIGRWKQAEEQLRESEKKYRQLVENANDAIFIAMGGAIVFSNDRLGKMLGYEVSDLLDIPFVNHIHPDDRIMVLERHVQRLNGKTDLPHTYAFRVVTSDGAILTVQLSTVVIEWSGKPATLNFMRDITELKQLEEVMIQNDKMISIGGLAAGMAHEINNPLAGVIQAANVMADRLSNLNLTANRKAAAEVGLDLTILKKFMENRGILKLMDGITESGRRISEIVNNMLSFARKSDDNKSEIEINELIDKSLELAATDYNLKKHYDFKSIKIVREYTPDLPVVTCDVRKIQQVILNLLRNGAQAMQSNDTENPTFNINTRLVNDGRIAEIRLGDNGPGMNEETRKRIFEPFFTTKPEGEGTGLGLSVSYFIITEDHGGEMSVESRLENGTEFIIRLPIKPGEPS